MLLDYLYPELEEKWIVRYDGTFYRNYSRDVLSMAPDEAQVWLSRDSLLSLLPKGLISKEDELREGRDRTELIKALELQLRVLTEAFLPFDTFSFRRLLRAERMIEELLGDKLTWLLKTYYDFDLEAVENPYVREFAVLLPGIRRWRGDFQLLRNLLASTFHCEVQMLERRFGDDDSTRAWIPEIRYELLIPDLSPEQYGKLHSDILPLRDFLAEWFMPMEVRLEIAVKHHQAAVGINGEMTLDYNTELL